MWVLQAGRSEFDHVCQDLLPISTSNFLFILLLSIANTGWHLLAPGNVPSASHMLSHLILRILVEVDTNLSSFYKEGN